MKKLLTLLVLTICLSGQVSLAQDIRINIYTGYVFDDQFDSYYDAYNYYEGTIEGGLQWGAGIEYMLKPTYGLELLYFRQDAKAPTYYVSDYYQGAQFTEFDLDANYILLGGQRHFGKPGSVVDGYGGLMAGCVVANLSVPDGGSGSTTKFAWGLKGGANLWFSDHVAIKLQAQLLSATQSMGGSFYFGAGGSGAGLSSYSTIFQFTLGGGLAFRFGDDTKTTTPTTTP